MNTYFITDAHLGSIDDQGQRERDLVAFLDRIKVDCERLVLLGDMFDFWFTYKYVVPKGQVRFLGKLAELADRGIEIHYFIGNHDMWLFDYLSEEIGVIMHEEPCEMTLGDKRFFIGHGDGLGGNETSEKHDRNYLRLKKIFRCRFNQQLFSWVNPRIGFSLARKWSAHSRKSHFNKLNHYLGDDKEGIVIHCKKLQSEKHFDYFVFGHRHLALEMPIGDATYINVGDWLENRDYAVFDGNTLQLHHQKEL